MTASRTLSVHAFASLALIGGMSSCSTDPDPVPGDALVAAAAAGDEAEAIRELEGGGDPNARDDDGRTALMYSARKGMTGLALELLRKGADVEAAAGDGKTALIDAAEAGEVGVLELLLQNGARKDSTDSAGHTALAYADAKVQQGAEPVDAYQRIVAILR